MNKLFFSFFFLFFWDCVAFGWFGIWALQYISLFLYTPFNNNDNNNSNFFYFIFSFLDSNYFIDNNNDDDDDDYEMVYCNL